LVMETESGHRLSLFDPRRFGSVDLVTTDALAGFAPFAAMGPEPLGDEFTPAYLRAALAGRASPIKAMLLDQRIVAGLGNIYVCEA
ncbi:DNA-formamidopyrimidine glycosylase, partial [Acinetobacter baumannii]